jgi:hypothetical protein
MKIYKLNYERIGFQISIPDDWHQSQPEIFARISDALTYSADRTKKPSYIRILNGPQKAYIHFIITLLYNNEPEPSIEETNKYFEGLTNRQNLFEIDTGTINIFHKDHFCTTYYRMRLIGITQIQFFRKYCIYLNRNEYIATSFLYGASQREHLPTDQLIEEKVRQSDNILLTMKPQDR